MASRDTAEAAAAAPATTSASTSDSPQRRARGRTPAALRERLRADVLGDAPHGLGHAVGLRGLRAVAARGGRPFASGSRRPKRSRASSGTMDELRRPRGRIDSLDRPGLERLDALTRDVAAGVPGALSRGEVDEARRPRCSSSTTSRSSRSCWRGRRRSSTSSRSARAARRAARPVLARGGAAARGTARLPTSSFSTSASICPTKSSCPICARSARPAPAQAAPPERRERQGLYILERLRRRRPDLPVLLTTAYEDIAFEEEALRLRADAFTYAVAGGRVGGRRRRRGPAPDPRGARRRLRATGRFFWGSSAAMRELRRKVSALAPTPMPLLVTGPDGHGQEPARARRHPSALGPCRRLRGLRLRDGARGAAPVRALRHAARRLHGRDQPTGRASSRRRPTARSFSTRSRTSRRTPRRCC